MIKLKVTLVNTSVLERPDSRRRLATLMSTKIYYALIVSVIATESGHIVHCNKLHWKK